MDKISWALSPILLPPLADEDVKIINNAEDNADIFYQPYMKNAESTEDSADRFYSPYMKTVANYNALNLQPSLYNAEDTADVFYRDYYNYNSNAQVDSTNKADQFYRPYLSTLIDYEPKQIHSQELPGLSHGQQYQGPVDSTNKADDLYQPYADDFYQPHLSTLLDYEPRLIQREELPSLAGGQQYQGPIWREFQNINDMENEVFDVPKVLLKAFRN